MATDNDLTAKQQRLQATEAFLKDAADILMPEYDPSHLKQADKWDATATAAFKYGYKNTITEILADPDTQAFIQDPSRNKSFIDSENQDIIYVLQEDGDFEKLRIRVNQDGREILRNDSNGVPYNIDGSGLEVNLDDINTLSAAFLQSFAPQYAADKRLPAGLNTLADIQKEKETSTTQIESMLEVIGLLENDKNEALLHSLLTQPYDKNQLTEALKDGLASRADIEALYGELQQFHALENLGKIIAAQNISDYITNGTVPGAPEASKRPNLSEPWKDNPDYDALRVFNKDIFTTINNGTATTDTFKDNSYASSFIEAQGWSGQLTGGQVGCVVREMLLKDSAERRGIEDPHSPAGKAAFLDDWRNGAFHKGDMELALRAADHTHATLLVERMQAQREFFDLGPDVPPTHTLFNSPKAFVRQQAFHDMFKQPSTLTQEDGSTILTTLTVDEAVDEFFRMPDSYKGYSIYQDNPYQGYDRTYEQLVEEFGNQTNEAGRTFPEEIKYIMEHVTVDRFYSRGDIDGGAGSFAARWNRRATESVEQRLLEQHLKDQGVLPQQSPQEITIDTYNGGKLLLHKDAALLEKSNAQETDYAQAGISTKAEQIRMAAAELTEPLDQEAVNIDNMRPQQAAGLPRPA